MFSPLPIMVLLAACAVEFVFSQNLTVEGFFNISEVPLSTRSSWCTSQSSVCDTLCSGSTNLNTCSNMDLTFNCTCSANMSTPGLQYYQNTVPTLECTSAYANCINLHPNDLTGQQACATDINSTCGTIDSTKATITAQSSSASSASATSAPSTTSGTASSATGTSSSSPSASANAAAGVVIGVGQQYGMGALIAGVIAAFGFML